MPLNIQKTSFMGSVAGHISPVQLLCVIGSCYLDAPSIIHLSSRAVVAVTVVSGAGVYRERKEYYRCRIRTSKVATQHNSSLF